MHEHKTLICHNEPQCEIKDKVCDYM